MMFAYTAPENVQQPDPKNRPSTYNEERLAEEYTYHAPTDVTRPLYAQLRDAEARAKDALGVAVGGSGDVDRILFEYGTVAADGVRSAVFSRVSQLLRDYAMLVERVVPTGQRRKILALDRIATARMLVNEYVATGNGSMLNRAMEELILARMDASAAVALGYAAKPAGESDYVEPPR